MPLYSFTLVRKDGTKHTYPLASAYTEKPLTDEDFKKQLGIELEIVEPIPANSPRNTRAVKTRIELPRDGGDLFVTVDGSTVNSWHWPPHDKKKPVTRADKREQGERLKEEFRVTVDGKSGGVA